MSLKTAGRRTLVCGSRWSLSLSVFERLISFLGLGFLLCDWSIWTKWSLCFSWFNFLRKALQCYLELKMPWNRWLNNRNIEPSPWFKVSVWFSMETKSLEYDVAVKVLVFRKKGNLTSSPHYLDLVVLPLEIIFLFRDALLTLWTK